MHASVRYIHDHADILREEHAKSDELGQLTEKAIRVMKDSGGFRLLLSKDAGGYEEHPTVFGEWVRAVGRYNPSAGWIAGVVGIHPWQMAIMDEKVRQEIYGEDPDTLVASPYAPRGTATRVDGGYLFSTEVPYSTGCDHSEWAILGGVVLEDDGKPGTPPEMRHFMMPISEVERVPDSWNVMGLEGTGSKVVRAKEVFVPEYRTMHVARMNAGEYAAKWQPGNPLYQLPFGGIFCYAIASGVFGIAEGLIEQFRLGFGTRENRIGAARVNPHQQAAFVNAESVLDSSVIHVDVRLSRLLDMAARGESIPMDEKVRFRAFKTCAAQRVVTACDELFRKSGSQSMWTDQPIERYFRDLMVGGSHMGVEATQFYADYTLVSLDPDAQPALAY